MSNRNRNSSTKSTTRNATTVTAAAPSATRSTTTTTTTSTSRSSSRPSQVMVTPPAATPTTQTPRRARKPVTIRVRSTGEEIRRVPVERSGYRVVRYEGRYHTVRGGGRTTPYIVGSEDGEDALGRA
jgi:hypothetical protein